MKRHHFATWPALTESLIKIYLSTPVATAKGHLNQEHQGLDVVYSLVSSEDKAYMDLTGRFPICSSRGNEYILIVYHYDANAILGVPLKNRQAVTITKGWQHLHSQYFKAGVAPSTWILDNETSIE